MHSSVRLDRLGRRMMEGTYTRVALNGTVLPSQRKECCMRFRTRMVLLLPLLESRSRTIRDRELADGQSLHRRAGCKMHRNEQH